MQFRNYIGKLCAFVACEEEVENEQVASLPCWVLFC